MGNGYCDKEQKEEYFEKTKNLIYKIAWGYQHRGDIDDIIGVAMIGAMKAFNNYDGSTAITTIVYKYVNQEILNFLTKEKKHQGQDSVELRYDIRSFVSTPETNTAFKSTLQNLSEEAKQVVRIVLDSPVEILELGAKEKVTHCDIRVAIRKRLAATLTRKKVNKTFSELKQAFGGAV